MPHFYSLTLQRATAITHAIYGNFSAPKAQEIVVARGKILELLRPDEAGKVQCILSTEVFGLIRSVAAFRLIGANRDYIVVSSDSGRVVVLEYSPEKNQFEKVHQETYGKTGCRRIIPGEFLAVDPKGRAFLLAAVEKQKFGYILNRDSNSKLTISSPLDAHKNGTLVSHIIGVDVGFDNPLFAALEITYEELDNDPSADMPQKMLTFYEMDLGLNHVTRKFAEPVDMSAHLLIAVPGGQDGPSGVLVCCENCILYRRAGHPEVVCAIPRRLEMAQEKGLMVVCAATHKLKDFFFFLVQSEYGDLYKVTLTTDEDTVTEIQVKYFDTLALANSLCVLKTGFLFVASEFGNHALYQFTGIGTDDDDPICTSSHPHGPQALVAFKPRALKNLLLYDDLPSLSPVLDMKVIDATGEGSPQLYCLCGRGPRSTMRVLKHGLSVSEMAVSALPGRPHAVWTVRGGTEEAFDRYIVVSFIDVTLVLSIGDTVEEVLDSGFLATAPTLFVQLMADGSYVQVHPQGIRHLLQKRTNEWRAPGNKRVVCAGGNERQIVLALSGGEVVFFELDESHTLAEVAKRDMNYEVTCVSVQPVPQNRHRAHFLAVGGVDNTVRILSLDRERPLKQLSAQALQSPAESVCILELKNQGASMEEHSLYLNVGLSKGILIRSVVDFVTGTLSDQRSRFLGPRGVKLHRVSVQGQPAMVALSDKPWLAYLFQGAYQCVPLSYETLEYASSFASEQCPEGLVAIAQNTLRILAIERLGEVFHQQSIELSYTPRKFVPLPPPLPPAQALSRQSQAIYLAMLEADHNAYNEETKREIRSALQNITLTENDQNEELPETQIGTFKAGEGKWGSCVRVLDPVTQQTAHKLDLDVDEAAVCLTVCYFQQLPERPCLIVGTASNMTLHPRVAPKCTLKTFLYDDQYNLQLVHATPLDAVPTYLFPFEGRLLVAAGRTLRIYELGKRKLLRKCEYRGIPEGLMWMHATGDRIFAGDLRESLHVFKYRKAENQLYVLADDQTPRWLTSATTLDYNTVLLADKFDSLVTVRVPSAAKGDQQADMSGLRIKADTSYITGQTHKLDTVTSFHVGETVTAVEKAALMPGGAELITYATIMGSIGVFYPIPTREEVDFLQHLEMFMRTERAPLAGREHIMFRSFYQPVSNTIDGDLCEQFSLLRADVQKNLANELDKTPAEVIKKLEDIRNRII
jgi:splicing factor 3B subunit 3